MNTESFQALRRANPRGQAVFPQSVEACSDAVSARVASAPNATAPKQSRRLVGVSLAGASAAAVAVAVAALTVGSLGGSPGVEDAAAAVKKAATVTAASAERSGTAAVRITHDGEFWAGKTIRWHGGDLAVTRDAPQHPLRPSGLELLVVDGIMYGVDPGEGGWIRLGSPDSIDPGSGTTPDDYLAAVREDVGGMTLRRIGNGLTGLDARRLDDGSTVYSGTVAAGAIARETGFKEGRTIRVLPFGYVAHGAAADAAAPLDAAVTVGGDGLVREITLTWGTWRYTVMYDDLGATPAPVAPANARDLLRDRRR
jgi:hypothetical protein